MESQVDDSAISERSPSPTTSSEKPGKRRRPAVRVACDACRRRKHACDGGRPACSSCIRRQVPCAYDTLEDGETRQTAMKRENEALRAQLDDIATTFELLKAIPEDKALQLLKAVRSSRDPLSALVSLLNSMRRSRAMGAYGNVRNNSLPDIRPPAPQIATTYSVSSSSVQTATYQGYPTGNVDRYMYTPR